MSILTKSYEISVWEDQWDPERERFIEKKILVIGSDQMTYQGRALKPVLTKNINGTKKLTFEMYRMFIDSVTGEKVHNEFVDYLISERKVKLFHESRWYDFIIKDISENSATYLCSYSLEDALVQELSKNGFNIEFDAELMNNIGDAKYLATETLKETDWEVEGETFVDKIDESLVYLKTTSPIRAYKLYDDYPETIDANGKPVNFLTKGLKEEQIDIPSNTEVLAFYSSCKNKPYRFQFIYIPSGYSKETVTVNKHRQIVEKNCQFYIEYKETEYQNEEDVYGFSIPKDFVLLNKTYIEGENTSDSTISTRFRGARYGFSQKIVYVPLLEKYCYVYSDASTGSEVYGYSDNKYVSPVFNTNLITNTDFLNAVGWISTYSGSTSSARAKAESIYGKFVGGKFVKSLDVLVGNVKVGQTFEEFLNDERNKCCSYMRLEMNNPSSLVVNSGPYDNRTIIENMPLDSEWAFYCEAFSADGSQANPQFAFGEYLYNPSTGGYSESSPGIKLQYSRKVGKYSIYKVVQNPYTSENEFVKNSNLKLLITLPAGTNSATYYIKNIEFFKASYDDKGDVIGLSNQDEKTDGIITKEYKYFQPTELETAQEEKAIHYDLISNELAYSRFVPKYNSNGEKLRTITAKESNYFNILQSIAETFECWLELEAVRDSYGTIARKVARFKNYSGKDNYAAFRYGVNLKDIQRTFSSKNIVTKLIVKQNSNEHSEGKFCTIARAGSNPTGDNCIYDFSYLQNQGLISANNYIDTLYKIDGAKGPDIGNDTVYNLQGYFPRIRSINQKMLRKSDLRSQANLELLKLKADLEVQKAKKSSALTTMEDVSASFRFLTGANPSEITDGKISINRIELDGQNKFEANAEEKITHVSYYDSTQEKHQVEVSFEEDYSIVTFTVTREDNRAFEHDYVLYITAYPKIITDGEATINKTIYCSVALNTGALSATTKVPISIDLSSPDVQSYLKQYIVAVQEQRDAGEKETTLNAQITAKQNDYDDLLTELSSLREHKQALNSLFYEIYASFIQEGTWIDEEYCDDEKYYIDALSVMYNSCYPKVAYSINTIEVGKLPGYEDFAFEVGEKTWVEDGDFFGYDKNGYPIREEVIITEKSDNLENPSASTNKVQNFKTQFQDLFQKITATVQQTQYNKGAYEKGVAEANAIAENSVSFLTETLGEMTVNLSNPDLVSESTDKSSQLKIVDGKILIGAFEDGTNNFVWRTGLSSGGIAADLITAGAVNTKEIQIYNGDNPTFRWDARGISAYDYTDFNSVISGVNTTRFVRFDKHGLYGIDGSADGTSWTPGQINGVTAEEEIDREATFALTWKGLKVTGDGGVEARLGRYEENGEKVILNITNSESASLMSLDNNGRLKVGNWSVSQSGLESTEDQVATYNLRRTTTLGSNTSEPNIFLDAQGRSAGEHENIVFKAGDHFYVSQDGALYATEGYIANWEITGSGLYSYTIDELTSEKTIHHRILPSNNDESEKMNFKIRWTASGTELDGPDEYPLISFGQNSNASHAQVFSIKPMYYGATNGGTGTLCKVCDGQAIIISGTLTTMNQGAYSKRQVYFNNETSEITLQGIGGSSSTSNGIVRVTYTLKLTRSYTYEGTTIKETTIKYTISNVKNIANNSTYSEKFQTYWGLSGGYIAPTLNIPCIITDNGSLKVTNLQALYGEIGRFSIFVDGTIGFRSVKTGASDQFDVFTNYTPESLVFTQHDYGAGTTALLNSGMLKIFTGIETNNFSSGQTYYIHEISENYGFKSSSYTYSNQTYLTGQSCVQMTPHGLSYYIPPSANNFDWPHPSLRSSTASIRFTTPDSNNTNITFTVKQAGTEKSITVQNLLAMQTSINNLGFKGPYAIRYGSASGTQIGRIYQKGNMVYGAIWGLDVNDASKQTFYFTIEGTSTTVNIPGPIDGQTLNWVYKGNRNTTVSVVNSNNYLSMTTGNNFGNPAGTVYGNWTYFCYEIYSGNSSHHVRKP